MDGFAKRLAKLRREAQREWKRRTKERKGPPPKRDARRPVDWPPGAATILPSAVFFYEHGQVPAWLALLVAALLTAAVVTVYASWLSHQFTGQRRVLQLAKWVGVPLVVFYCGYSLLYVSQVNAKADAVRAYYTAVHPLLRLALSTWGLVDPDIVVTDTRRAREDYPWMKL